MMKKRTRQVFDAAFKMDAVREMRTRMASGVPVSVIARDRLVRPEQLRAWAKQLDLRAGQAPTDVFPGEGKVPSAEEEVRRLRRENERLLQEVAFLKKASAYFAKEL
jgi:transposase